MQLQDDYLAAYRSLKLVRDVKGVLVAEFHSYGEPFTFTAQDHTQFVDAFYRIAQDRTNKIVILTGAGGEFIPYIDFSSFGDVADPGVWSQARSTLFHTKRHVCRLGRPESVAWASPSRVTSSALRHFLHFLLRLLLASAAQPSAHQIS